MLRWARTAEASTTQAQTTSFQLSEIAVQKEVVVFGDDESVPPHDNIGDRKHVASSSPA